MLFSFPEEPSADIEQALARLTETTLQLHQCDDIERLLQCGVQHTRQLFASDRALIFQHTLEPAASVVAESVETGWQSLQGRSLQGALGDQPLVVPTEATVRAIADVDQSDLNARTLELLVQWQVKALLVVPIWVTPPEAAPRQWGLLMVQRCSAPYVWAGMHQQAIQHIATQLGCALERLILRQHIDQLQRQTETRIQQTEDKYRRATQACSIGVWDWDLATNDIYLDPLLKEMLGYRDDEIRNHLDDWAQFVYADDLPAVMAAATEHLAGRSPEYRVEHRMVNRDGSLRWMLARGRVLRSPDGTPYRMVGTDVDITDRKLAELALERQAQQERAFNEVVQMVSSSLDLETIFAQSIAPIALLLNVSAAIVQYLPALGCWRHLVVHNPNTEQVVQLNRDVPDADNPIAERLKQLQIVQIDNADTLQDPINRRLAALFPGTWLLIPIILDGQVWGALTLVRSTDSWRSDEIDLSRRVVDQLAIAIHQANLYQQLRAAHERDELVLRSIGEGIWDWDPIGDIARVSERYWEILGYVPPYPHSTHLQREMARVHPEDLPRVQQAFQRHLTHHERYDIEMRVRHPAGHYGWVRARGQAVRNAQGQPVRVLGTIEDISDRKQAELDLKASEAFRRQVMELAPISLYIYDFTMGQLVYCNSSYEASLGYSLTEIQAMGETFLTTLYHPDDRDRIEAHDRQVLADREGRVYELEYQCRRKDGSTLTAYSREVVLTRNADGTPRQVLGFGVDITERKAIEEALRQSNALYRSLAEAMPQFLYRKDRAGRITYVNPALLHWLKVSETELIGKTVYDLYPPELAAQYDADDRRVLATGEIIDRVEEHERPQQGDRFYVQVIKSPVRNGNSDIVGTQGIFWDVTARQRLEQALQDSRDQLAVILNSLHASVAKFRLFEETNAVIYDYYSPGCEGVFGYPAETLKADPTIWRSRVVPEDLETIIYPATRDLFAGRSHQTIEYRFRHPDDSLHWIRETATVRRSESEDCWIFTTVATDISDRKQAELELEQARNLLQQVLDHLPVGVFAKAADTLAFTLWNPACTELMGYSHAEAIGHTDYDLFPSAQADRCVADDRTAIASRTLWQRPEEVILTRDGRSRIIHNRKVAVYDASGQAQLVIGIVEDVTARIEAEAAVRQREEEFRSLAENLPDGILRVNTAFCITYANPTIERRTGYLKADLVGRSLTALGWPNALLTRWRTAIARALTSGEEQQIETQELFSSGMHIFQSRIVPERDRDGQVTSVLIVSRDITHLKRAQTALLRRVDQEHSLRMITQHIRETLDLQAILSTAVAEVQRSLNADRTLIFQIQSDRRGLVIEEAVRPGYAPTLGAQWQDNCFPRVCQNSYSQGHIIADIAEVAGNDCLFTLMRSLQVRSKMVAPITQRPADGSVPTWGLIITHACATRRQWQTDELELLQQVADQLAIAIQQSELHQQLQAANQELERISNTDALTQVANRRRFDEVLAAEWQRAQREQREIALILCDIDYFKQYNDTYGHPAGDECLTTVAATLQQCVNRVTDCFARYGGEEFGVILPHTSLPGAIAVVQKMQAAIAALDLHPAGASTAARITLSFGITAARPHRSPNLHHLIRQADQALYQAKQAGRDRYAVMTDPQA